MIQLVCMYVLHVWTYANKTSLTIHLIEMHFETFANRADPDQAALVRAAWSGSTLLLMGMIRNAPTLTDLTSNFFVLCSSLKFYYIIIHSGWSLAWICMSKMVKLIIFNLIIICGLINAHQALFKIGMISSQPRGWIILLVCFHYSIRILICWLHQKLADK